MISLPRHPLKRAGLAFTFLWFLVGGIGHFLASGFFVSICPPWVPEPLRVVQLSGALELLLAALLIPVRTRSLAGLALLALIVAVTPANVWMLIEHDTRFAQFPVGLLWLRLLIQAAFLVNVWWCTRPEAEPAAPGSPSPT
jgi:uncharacterized membrane protein